MPKIINITISILYNYFYRILQSSEVNGFVTNVYGFGQEGQEIKGKGLIGTVKG